MDDEFHEYYAMQGIVADWNGVLGHILTESGDCIFISAFHLRRCGFEGSPNVGDQIHFWADKRVTVTYRVRRVRVLVPQEPDQKTLSRLAKVHEKAASEQSLRDNGYAHETLAGTIDTFDQKNRHGFIRSEDGELVFVKADGLRRADMKRLKVGCSVNVRIIRLGEESLISKILEVTPPRKL